MGSLPEGGPIIGGSLKIPLICGYIRVMWVVIVAFLPVVRLQTPNSVPTVLIGLI